MGTGEDSTPRAFNKNSVLDSTKKILGLGHDYEVFDHDIIVHINSAFSTLNQLGVGREDPYFIEDHDNEWNEFFEDQRGLESAKSYVYAKVRLLFDPPATSYGIQALEKMCTEYEWRLSVQAEKKVTT